MAGLRDRIRGRVVVGTYPAMATSPALRAIARLRKADLSLSVGPIGSGQRRRAAPPCRRPGHRWTEHSMKGKAV